MTIRTRFGVNNITFLQSNFGQNGGFSTLLGKLDEQDAKFLDNPLINASDHIKMHYTQNGQLELTLGNQTVSQLTQKKTILFSKFLQDANSSITAKINAHIQELDQNSGFWASVFRNQYKEFAFLDTVIAQKTLLQSFSMAFTGMLTSAILEKPALKKTEV
jgi:hypothetical protein